MSKRTSRDLLKGLTWQKAKATYFSVIFLLLGSLMIYAGAPKEVQWGIKALLLRDLGISLFISGVIGIIFDLFLKNDFFEEMKRESHVNASVSNSQILAVTDRFENTDWKTLISHTRELKIIGFGATTWLNTNRDFLKAMLSHGGTIKLLVPDPEIPNCLAEMESRFGYGEAVAKDRIIGTTGELRKMLPAKKKGKKTGGVVVYYTSKPPSYSAYIFDNDLILVTYSQAREKTLPPTLHFGSGPVWTFYDRDVTTGMANANRSESL